MHLLEQRESDRSDGGLQNERRSSATVSGAPASAPAAAREESADRRDARSPSAGPHWRARFRNEEMQAGARRRALTPADPGADPCKLWIKGFSLPMASTAMRNHYNSLVDLFDPEDRASFKRSRFSGGNAKHF